jgi:hypothetical protein
MPWATVEGERGKTVSAGGGQTVQDTERWHFHDTTARHPAAAVPQPHVTTGIIFLSRFTRLYCNIPMSMYQLELPQKTKLIVIL